MKILLMDLDLLRQSKRRKHIFPNLALMKLSAYHKAKGDEVYLNFPLQQPDITYASCVFTWNSGGKDRVSNEAVIGGSGIDLEAKLPPEVEHIKPDYDLYPHIDFSMGFTSRGCPRRCSWCIVPEKEGGIKPATKIYEFWDHRHTKIILLDNNLLASPNWQQTMEDLITEGLEVDFNQGLDIRLLNSENLEYLKQVKAKELRFAFDDMRQEKAVRQGIELLLEAGIRSRRLSFYVLAGFADDTTVVERLKILHSYNVDIYPMWYRDPKGRRSLISSESLKKIKSTLGAEGLFWHGARGNINKFLRLVGRLPG